MLDEIHVVPVSDAELEDEALNGRQTSDIALPGRVRQPIQDPNDRELQEVAVPIDRYIIKYKEGGRETVLERLSDRLDSVVEIAVETSESITRDSFRASDALVGTDSRIASDTRLGTDTRIGAEIPLRGEDLRQVAPPIEQPVEQAPNPYADRWEVLILNEPIIPSEFANELRRSGLGREIEYIQPDFRISINSFAPEERTTEHERGRDFEHVATELALDLEVNEPYPNPDDSIDLDLDGNEEEAEENIEYNPEDEETLQTTEANPVIIAVLDTGVDISHPDIAPFVWASEHSSDTHGWNFVDDNNILFSTTSPNSSNHGTHKLQVKFVLQVP